MLVFQARPARSADLPRSLPRLLVFRPARRPLYPVDAATHPHLLLRGAHGHLRRLLQRFKALCRRQEPAPRAPLSSAKAREVLRLERRSTQPRHGSLRSKRRSAGDWSLRSSAAPLSQGTGTCALSAAPPPAGARASSATPLSYGIIQTTGTCTSVVAPLSPGPGARAPSAAPPSRVPRSSQTAAPARRSFQRGCPTPPPPYHAVAVGLRCGKADTEAPRSRMKLDSAFPRNSGGRSTLFPAKEEWTR